MHRRLFRFIIAAVILLFPLTASPALAQEGDSQLASDLPPLLLYTDYPSQVIGMDETTTLTLNLRAGATPQIAQLSIEDLPEGWSVTFRGGERVIHAAYVTPDDETTVTLRVEPPQNVEPGEYSFTVVAEGENTRSELPVELMVQERTPASLSWEVELPTLRGRPNTTFSYNATLENEGGEELSVELTAEAPPGFMTTFQSSGQEVTTLPIGPGESERVTIQLEAITEVPAGTYPLTVHALGGDVEASLDLAAEVVGQSTLSLTTPGGLLSGSAEAGAETTYTLLLQNTGSAPARNITMSSTAPNGWDVTFEPEQIAEIPPDALQEVIARVQPPDNAIAGDYVVNFNARPEGSSSESIEYRITVRTSTLWGVAGIGLIAVAVLVVAVAVARFGRR